MALLDDVDHCSTCGHKIGPGRIRFNRNLARLFVIVARASSEKGVFTVDMLKQAGMTIEYTIVAKLKYFGIIAQEFDNHRKGVYQITYEGWDFLRDDLEVPEYVDVKRMEVVNTSPKTLSLWAALQGNWFGQEDWIRTWRETNPKREDPQLSLGV